MIVTLDLLISYECMRAKSFQSCPTFCDLMDSRPPSSSVCGILQASKLVPHLFKGVPHSSCWLCDVLAVLSLVYPFTCLCTLGLLLLLNYYK